MDGQLKGVWDMSSIWPNVTRKNPCEICGKPDWCSVGDKVIKCQRVHSDNPCPTGGWYHRIEDKVIRHYYAPPPRRPSVAIDAESIMRRLTASELEIKSFAGKLGVSVKSLNALGVARFPQHAVRDNDQRVSGWR